MIFTRLQRPNYGAISPLHRVLTLRSELDNLFQRAWRQPSTASDDRLPALDLYEDKEGLVAKVELPGMKKEDITISLEDDVLTVSGERKQDPQLDGATVCRCERTLGRFERSLTLPGKVDAAKIKAAYTDGVLTIRLPKTEEAKQVPIEVK
jgi:HSP20 family protein